MFTAALLTVESGHVVTDKMYTYTVKCSAIKDEVMPFAATWVPLEVILIGKTNTT